MATEILKDAFVSINAVDLSDHVRQVAIDYSGEVHDITIMGDAGRRRLGGLKDWSMTVEMFQDFAAAEVDATVFGLVGVQTAIKVRKSKTDAISTTNPEYQGNGILESYPILGNQVGDPATVSMTFRGSDGAALIRDVTP